MPKLLSNEQKQERVRLCEEFVAAVQRRSKAMLDNIITIDETMVSYHTPESKKIQTVDKKGAARPKKGKDPCQPDQTDVDGFFGQQGPDLQAHCAEGHFHQRCLHREVLS
jgi:uncharacterized protein YnzC (UPF0291/DUF896 family)